MKCTFCHQEKPIIHRVESDMARVNFKYCQQCYDIRKEKRECGVCGHLVAFEDYPKHNSDYHEGENLEWMDNYKGAFEKEKITKDSRSIPCKNKNCEHPGIQHKFLIGYNEGNHNCYLCDCPNYIQ